MTPINAFFDQLVGSFKFFKFSRPSYTRQGDYVDPLVEKVAEAAQNIQTGMNLATSISLLDS